MRLNNTFIVALLTLGLVHGVHAQAPDAGRFGGAAGCVRENASRLPGDINCGETPTDDVVITHELEITTTVATPAFIVADCQTEITLEYTQRGNIARVMGEIGNTMCAASSGSFVVSVRTTDAAGIVTTQEFPETWQRSDDQPVSFSADYAIGDDVDLTRVRTVRSRCLCTQPE